ncbi:MAG: hypothetical protein ABUL60_00680 [Myxococcales bacterium]
MSIVREDLSWLALTFAPEDGAWRLVFAQSTARLSSSRPADLRTNTLQQGVSKEEDCGEQRQEQNHGSEHQAAQATGEIAHGAASDAVALTPGNTRAQHGFEQPLPGRRPRISFDGC